MKVLRLGLGAALIVGILLLSSAILFGRGKQAQEINVVVGVPTKDLYETPQVIGSAVTTSTHTVDVVNTPGVPDVPTTMLTGTTDIPIYPGARDVEPYGGSYYHTPGGDAYTFYSDNSIDDILSFYKRELAKRVFKNNSGGQDDGASGEP